MSGRRWSAEETETIRAMATAGHADREIAEALGYALVAIQRRRQRIGVAPAHPHTGWTDAAREQLAALFAAGVDDAAIAEQMGRSRVSISKARQAARLVRPRHVAAPRQRPPAPRALLEATMGAARRNEREAARSRPTPPPPSKPAPRPCTEGGTAHRWRLDEPHGSPTVRSVCRLCGAEREEFCAAREDRRDFTGGWEHIYTQRVSA